MDSSTGATNRSLGDELVRIAWLFQAGCALPTLLILGFMAFAELFYPYISLYDFITDTVNALLAAGIIFLVLVQRKLPFPGLDRLYTLYFEAAKSGFATAMWLWLLLDSAIGPWKNRPHYDGEVRARIIRAVISGILLWILFYPTLAYSVYAWFQDRREKLVLHEEGDEEIVVGENTPLLE